MAAAVAATLVYGIPALTGRAAPRAMDLSVTGPVPVQDRMLSTQIGSQFGDIAFSPDGRLLAAGSSGQAYLWNLVTGQRLITLDDPGDGIGAEAFSPNGKLLADGDSVLNRVYLWDTNTGRHTATLTAPGPGGIDGVAFSPNGQLLAAGDSNKHVYVWNTATGRLNMTLVNASIDGGVAFSPDGQLLAAAGVTGSGGLTYLWNAATGQKVATLHDPGGQSVNAVAFNPNGKVLATGDSDGSVYEFDTATDLASDMLTPPGQHGPVNSVTFSPDGALLVAADGNSHAYVWNAATEKIAGELRWAPATGRCGRWRSARTANCWQSPTATATSTSGSRADFLQLIRTCCRHPIEIIALLQIRPRRRRRQSYSRARFCRPGSNEQFDVDDVSAGAATQASYT